MLNIALPGGSPFVRPPILSDYPCRYCGSDVELIVEARATVSAQVDRGGSVFEVDLTSCRIWKCSSCSWQGSESELAESMLAPEMGGESLSFRAIESLMKPSLKIQPSGGGKSGKRHRKTSDKLLRSVDPYEMHRGDDIASRSVESQKCVVVMIRGLVATNKEFQLACAELVAEAAQELNQDFGGVTS